MCNGENEAKSTIGIARYGYYIFEMLRRRAGCPFSTSDIPDALFDVLPEAFGDQLHAEVAGMVEAAVRALPRTYILHVHEHVAMLLRHGLFLGVKFRTDVEAL